jgi:hypothetical protein
MLAPLVRLMSPGATKYPNIQVSKYPNILVFFVRIDELFFIILINDDITSKL